MALPTLPTFSRGANRFLQSYEQQPLFPELTPEEEKSLLEQVLGTGKGLLQFVGEILDTPGSVVRGLLAGEPGRALGGILAPSERVGGREMLEGWGALEKNQQGLDAGDVGGFAAEVALDPLTYLTLGGSALAKSGLAAKRSGLTKHLATAAPGVGRRVAQRQTSPRQVLQSIADPYEAASELISFERAAKGMKTPLDELIDRPLSEGAAQFNVPFRGPAGPAIGTGAGGEKLLRGMDTLGEKIRYSGPGRLAASVFTRGARGAMTEQGQRLGQAATQAEREAGVAAREAFAPHLRAFEEFSSGLDTAGRIQANDTFRAALEGQAPLPAGMAHLQPSVDEYRRVMGSTLALEQSEGLASRALDDLYADYATRRRFFFPGDKTSNDFPARLLTGRHGSQTAREDILRDMAGATSLINRLSVDPRLSGVARNMPPGQLDKAFWDQQEALVRNAIASAPWTPSVSYEHQRELARWLGGLNPEHVQKGIPVFPHNPLDDGLRRVELGQRAVGLARTIRETIRNNALDVNAAPVGAKPVREVVEQAGLDPNASLAILGREMGLPSVDDAANLYVPKELAEDIGRVVKTFQSPDEAGKIVQTLDKATQLFKTGVTTLWPGFHFRNQASGQIMNAMIGGFSPSSLMASVRMLKGETFEGAAELPIFRGQNLTDAEATRKLADLAFAHQVAPRGQGMALEGAVGTTLDRTMAADIPGVRPHRLKDIASSAIPRTRSEMNPLNITGVRTDTDVFAPARAGRDLAHLGESTLRLTPFIEFLKKGMDPAEAARKVRAAHVDYQDLSTVERSVLRRVLPFYSFTSGMAKFVADQLTTRPGGAIGQSLRAANNLRADGWTPDWLGESYPIPLGDQDDGTQRFLAGLDLMHEAPFELGAIRFKPGGGLDIGGTIGRTLQKLGSQASPYLTGPTEMAFGTDLFSGRKLEDLYPFPFKAQGQEGRAVPAGDKRDAMVLNQLIQSSPLSRAFTTGRKALDERKTFGDFLLSTVTGAKLTDVDMAKARDLEAADAAKEILSLSPRIRQFEKEYVPEEMREVLTPLERQLMRLRATQTARARRIAQERASAP